MCHIQGGWTTPPARVRQPSPLMPQWAEWTEACVVRKDKLAAKPADHEHLSVW